MLSAAGQTEELTLAAFLRPSSNSPRRHLFLDLAHRVRARPTPDRPEDALIDASLRPELFKGGIWALIESFFGLGNDGWIEDLGYDDPDYYRAIVQHGRAPHA